MSNLVKELRLKERLQQYATYEHIGLTHKEVKAIILALEGPERTDPFKIPVELDGCRELFVGETTKASWNEKLPAKAEASFTIARNTSMRIAVRETVTYSCDLHETVVQAEKELNPHYSRMLYDMLHEVFGDKP